MATGNGERPRFETLSRRTLDWRAISPTVGELCIQAISPFRNLVKVTEAQMCAIEVALATQDPGAAAAIDRMLGRMKVRDLVQALRNPQPAAAPVIEAPADEQDAEPAAPGLG